MTNRCSSRLTKCLLGMCHAMIVLIAIVTCIDPDQSVLFKHQQLAVDSDGTLPDMALSYCICPNKVSVSAQLLPNVYKQMLICFLVEGGWPYFKTLEFKRKGWPGNTTKGLTGECHLRADNSKFNIFTSIDFVNPLLDENEAGSSGPGT